MGSSVSKDQLNKKNVVIVGGGYGGMELASQLLKLGIPFTLIDPKEYFHHCVGALRCAVDPNFTNKTIINFGKSFGNQFVQGKVTAVDFENKKVTIDNRDDEQIEFTDIVFAVGSQGPFPGRTFVGSMSEVATQYQSLNEDIEKSETILIVGGGPVGVELAGEIGYKYNTSKKVVLVHPSEELVSPDFGNTFQTKIKSSLKNMKVTLVLGDRVENLGDLTIGSHFKQTVKTQKGEAFDCDLLLKCTGNGPCTTLTKTVFDSSKFDEKSNLLKVNQFLQVEGYDNVYALGDCVNTPEHKMAAHAGTHANCIASNFIKELKGQEKSPYKQKFNGMVVPVGPYDGAGWINGWTVPAIVVSLFKGRSLMSAQFWNMMGQPMPS